VAEGNGPLGGGLPAFTQVPREENFRLTSQICRAVVSVPANIAEGQARSSKREFARFLSIAKGSLMETETFLMIAMRLGYLSQTDSAAASTLITQISKMVTSLRAKMQ
jgi:four helix bundle protein